MNLQIKTRFARIPATLFKASHFAMAVLAFALGDVTLRAAEAQVAATGTIRGRVMNAANGRYLSKALVSVEGTNLEAQTDNTGDFVLIDVPVGDVTLKATFAGQPPATTTVVVHANEAVNVEMAFNGDSVKRDANGAVLLDPYTVAAERYKNAQEIAIQQERASVTIKNVVSADAFGDIPGGNVGEFVKFLPGVQIDYGAFQGAQTGYSESAPSGISIRGFGPEDTAILIDGMPVSNASPGSLTRQVGLDMLSINNASRVELIKVATPDMPNNSIGGQVNLITKSAFEFSKPSYSARVFFNMNSLNTDLGKTPGPVNKHTYKTTPGVEFSVSYPFSSTFGVTVTGYGARQYDQTNRAETTMSFSGSSSITNTVGPLSLYNPALTRFKVTDTGRLIDTTSANVKLDWKPTPSQTVSANFQYSTYTSAEAQRRLDFRPALAAGAMWNPTSFVGTTANSTTDMTVTTIDKVGDTKSAQLQYRFQHGGWNIFAGASISQSNGENKDRANGHYSEIGLKLNPGQVIFSNIKDGIPGIISTYNRTANGGGPRDYTLLSNYSLDGTIAKSGESSSKNTVGLYKLDVERALDFIPWLGTNTLTFKIGARRDQEKTEKWGVGTGYRDVIDTTKSSFYSVANILDDDYIGVSPGYGYPGQQWGSTYKLYELNKTNQIFITPTDGADAVNNWNSYVNQQKSLTETTDAAYAMLSGSFIKNRLSFVGGMRQEEKSREGYGPYTDGKWNYAKKPDGTLYRDSVYTSGVVFTTTTFLNDAALLSRMKAAGVDYPDHVLSSATASSLESRKRQLIPNRYINGKAKGDPSASLAAAFEVTKKITTKVSWSRSFGMPALEDAQVGILSGNNQFTITENDPIPADGTRGEIKVANPNILPSISTNWDYQVAYYTDTGGKLAITYYTKSVTNQSATLAMYSDNPSFPSVLDALGLDAASYTDWKLTTATNSDTVQKTHGFEYEARQDFSFLGGWGKHFQVFASYTIKSLETPASVIPVPVTTPSGTVVTFQQAVKTVTIRPTRLISAGLQFATRKFSAQIRGNYKNENEQANNRVSFTDGNFLRRIEPAESRIDVNFNYDLTKVFSVFLSGKDVFNGERTVIIRDDKGLLPVYAQRFDTKKFGVTWTFGVNARW